MGNTAQDRTAGLYLLLPEKKSKKQNTQQTLAPPAVWSLLPMQLQIYACKTCCANSITWTSSHAVIFHVENN
ncbi:hypothetical protein JOB18_022722 [Solea senegalensis]|uniref:Uncharacterized protein n=1 Tax=Solea senegalensis TaxID=28829 RepID=A0AAV6QWS7_SOLSE|nr:hypothetical protein JOB18_022722 [Solea senegalensis]